MLDDAALAEIDALLADADLALGRDYPGERSGRQPVHTAYVPADRYHSGLAGEWGRQALAALGEHAPDAEALAAATGLPTALVGAVWPRLVAKLEREPIEDLRVDFEDGYGMRGDAEEDSHAAAAAREMARDIANGTAPPYLGIRFKSLEAPTRRRGLRTLSLVLSGLAEAGGLPDGWRLTLPKVTSVAQVRAMVLACERLEASLRLPEGRLGFELQVETPQAVLGADGRATVAPMLHAAGGRCTGLHYGTYDYSASLGVAAAYQSMEHPVADHAKDVLQVAVAGTGVELSDGSTNVLPVGDRNAVHAAWRLHARLVRRSLERGIYQGWDLHPAQLVTRYLATYAFYRDGLPAAVARLRAYRARIEGGILDEPATARALTDFLRRGVACGALGHDEAGG